MELEAENNFYLVITGIVAVFMFLPELFFGMRIIVDVVLIVDEDPNLLVIITRFVLAAVCFGFAMLFLHYFRNGQSEGLQSNPSMYFDIQNLLNLSFIIFAMLHLFVSMMILGLLSYRLIMDVPGISLARCTAVALVIICTALQSGWMLKSVDLPTRPFSLVYIPLVIFQFSLWVYRDFFHVSPMAFDIWIFVALVLFMLDALLMFFFAFQPQLRQLQPEPQTEY